jgi:hypothetical protein
MKRIAVGFVASITTPSPTVNHSRSAHAPAQFTATATMSTGGSQSVTNLASWRWSGGSCSRSGRRRSGSSRVSDSGPTDAAGASQSLPRADADGRRCFPQPE